MTSQLSCNMKLNSEPVSSPPHVGITFYFLARHSKFSKSFVFLFFFCQRKINCQNFTCGQNFILCYHAYHLSPSNGAAYSFCATVNVSSCRCFMERQEGVDILGAFRRAVRQAAQSQNRHTLHKSDDCSVNEFLLLKASGNFKLITVKIRFTLKNKFTPISIPLKK